MTETNVPPGAATTDTREAIVQVRDLRKVYGGAETAVTALDGVSVDIGRATFTAVMGPSGSGKSTFMHCVAGLDQPTSGSILIDGLELATMSEAERTRLRRTRIGFVFQSFNLIPTLTARENITLPIDLARAKLDQAWFDEIVDVVGLGDRLDHRPAELSGGQQQRVACARALVTKPAVVFADEPTGNLDSVASAEVLGFLRRSVDEFGQTVVVVTHDPGTAAYADRVLFLADGKLVGDLADPSVDSVLEELRRHSRLGRARGDQQGAR